MSKQSFLFFGMQNINRLKSQIQKGRIEHAMQGIHGGGTKDEVMMQDPQEDQLISQIEAEKVWSEKLSLWGRLKQSLLFAF